MSARTINLPRDPSAFWRAFIAAQRRLDKVDLQLDYMCACWNPGLKEALAKAVKRQKRARIIFEALEQERVRRVASAKKRGGDALARFGGPRAVTRRRQYARQNFRPIVDGYVVVGKHSNGTPIVEVVS